MQPYFFPYIGYFQLIDSVDEFVIYDNIQYTKKGWINRNRILVDGSVKHITLPVEKASSQLDIRDRKVSEIWRDRERSRLINLIKEAYRKAPNFDGIFPLIEDILGYENDNLFEFICHSVKQVCRILEINTEITISSHIDPEPASRGAERVIDIVKKVDGDVYINPCGGVSLYDREEFAKSSITLKFLFTGDIIYQQFSSDFEPSLSIIDVLMFNDTDKMRELLNQYTLG